MTEKLIAKLPNTPILRASSALMPSRARTVSSWAGDGAAVLRDITVPP
jgi:hypothetical protein